MEAPREDVRRGKRLRALGFVVALGLIGAAVWAVTRNAGALASVREGFGKAPGIAIGGLLLMPLSSWLLTSAAFWTLTRVRAKVSMGEMTWLIGASWLLNFLPLSPGLVGRVAYQRSRHGLEVKASARIVVELIVTGWVVFGFALAATHHATTAWGLWVWVGAVLLGVTGPLFMGTATRRAIYAGALGQAFAIKSVDYGVWIARYALAFAVLGVAMTPAQCAALALVAQSAMLIPFIGNGLGVREWAVGLVAAALPAWLSLPELARPEVGEGLAADLLGRGAEVLVAIPVGLLSVWMLGRRKEDLGE